MWFVILAAFQRCLLVVCHESKLDIFNLSSLKVYDCRLSCMCTGCPRKKFALKLFRSQNDCEGEGYIQDPGSWRTMHVALTLETWTIINEFKQFFSGTSCRSMSTLKHVKCRAHYSFMMCHYFVILLVLIYIIRRTSNSQGLMQVLFFW